MANDSEALLSHYTDASGLEGITRRGELWCTGIRHLNDRSEFHYVHDIASNMVLETSETTPETIAHLWREIVDEARMRHAGLFDLREIDSVGACYVASFSEKDDDLNQFRAYGGHSPFQLMFSLESLRHLVARNGFQLIKCDYSQANLILEIEVMIKRAQERLSQMMAVVSQADNHLLQAAVYAQKREFWDGIQALAPRFKHEKFSEEEEWRLVSPFKSAALPDDSVNFRVRNGRITPYMICKLSSVGDPELTTPFGTPSVLQQVRVGPTNDFSLDLASTIHLLKARNYLGVGVSASTIPYRV